MLYAPHTAAHYSAQASLVACAEPNPPIGAAALLFATRLAMDESI